MAVYTTYDAEGLAEDVVDDIFMIDPADNPVTSMARTTTATARLHEFQEDELEAIKKNAQIEGDTAGAGSATPTVMRTVSCQIMEEVAEISGTQERVRKYGRDSEMSYQLMKKYMQIARDFENAVMGDAGGTGRQAGNAGAAGTARELTSFHNQLDASVIQDAALAADTAALEAFVLAAHLACYNAGGNPSYAVTDPESAGYFPAFALSAGRSREVMETELINAVDLYQSQYGRLDVILNRSQNQAAQCIALIDFEYLTTPTLTPTYDEELAKLGYLERRQVIREGTFAVLNSKSQALVDNVPAGLTPP